MRYQISYSKPNTRIFQVEVHVSYSNGEPRLLQLPVWRPGRYERADFAQQVIGFQVKSVNGLPVSYKKINSALWAINSSETSFIVQYGFYAAVLNAGSSWLSDRMLYVNPVNCLPYVPGREHEACHLVLDIPAHYTVAGARNEEPGRVFQFPDFHSLADSPFIASDCMLHYSFMYRETTFHFWFTDIAKPDWDKIRTDMEAIIAEQWNTMGDFPVKEYHVLCHLLPQFAYHGVEHLHSTVLTLGPAQEFMQAHIYNEYLGIFSHELFHVWNVKTIRPADLLPYNYAAENYSELGYVYEGLTTYYGDLFGLRSGVFSEAMFLGMLSEWITRYYHNEGRRAYSLAQSSFDTWLDGYKPGAPGRKVSIYNEGALCALMADLFIRRESQNASSLDAVMRDLYADFGKTGKGYTRNDYKRLLEKQAGCAMDFFFEKYLEGTEDYGPFLTELFAGLGLEMAASENPVAEAARFGFKTQQDASGQSVTAMTPGSPAELGGLSIGDSILGYDLAADEALADGISLKLQIKRMGVLQELNLESTGGHYFPVYRLQKKEKASKLEQEAYLKWISAWA